LPASQTPGEKTVSHIQPLPIFPIAKKALISYMQKYHHLSLDESRLKYRCNYSTIVNEFLKGESNEYQRLLNVCQPEEKSRPVQ
jgi:hypothetical protein